MRKVVILFSGKNQSMESVQRIFQKDWDVKALVVFGLSNVENLQSHPLVLSLVLSSEVMNAPSIFIKDSDPEELEKLASSLNLDAFVIDDCFDESEKTKIKEVAKKYNISILSLSSYS